MVFHHLTHISRFRFVIGVPATFLMYKKNFRWGALGMINVFCNISHNFCTCLRLPDDIWMVDLDSNKLTPARVDAELPVLPEPEGTILKNHLKQVKFNLILWHWRILRFYRKKNCTSLLRFEVKEETFFFLFSSRFSNQNFLLSFLESISMFFFQFLKCGKWNWTEFN